MSQYCNYSLNKATFRKGKSSFYLEGLLSFQKGDNDF